MHVTRRAKIVSTIGPACSSTEQINALVEAGIDVARLNMSHGEHAVHEEVYHRIRAAADATGRGVGILADLQGPKIRIGRFPTARYGSPSATSSPSPPTTSPAPAARSPPPTRASPATCRPATPS